MDQTFYVRVQNTRNHKAQNEEQNKWIKMKLTRQTTTHTVAMKRIEKKNYSSRSFFSPYVLHSILYFVFDILYGVVFRFSVCLHNFNWYYIQCNRTTHILSLRWPIECVLTWLDCVCCQCARWYWADFMVPM